jgi:CheY-like chemotaxis protein
LRQILFNVVGNAVKFTPHGTITVRMAAHELGDRWRLEFSVEDTGVGIASNELSRVFEPFEQTGSGVAAGTGTGLGVPISREIARCLGGDLRIRSELGMGTVVDVDVVVEASSWAEVSGGKVDSRRVVPLSAGATRPVILVVDDQEDNRLVLEELLTSVGFGVQNASDGQSAIDSFREARPDFVFMDLKMPGIGGAEAARRIRLLDGGATVPIVILSASVFDAEQVSKDTLGCDAFIRKPFREQEIWDVLERHLGIELSFKSSNRSVELDPEEVDLSHLGQESRLELRAALEQGDLDRAAELLDALDAGHSTVVQSLRRQLTSFDLDGLLARL